MKGMDYKGRRDEAEEQGKAAASTQARGDMPWSRVVAVE